MDKSKLQADFTEELSALVASRVGMPITFSPVEAWYLLSGLQLLLRHPQLDGTPREFLDSLARNIETRLTKGRPAMAELSRMGWDAANDEPAGGGERAEDPPPPPDDPIDKPAGEYVEQPPPPGKGREPEPEPEAEPEKRKPERTPLNKQLDVAENKEAGKRRRR